MLEVNDESKQFSDIGFKEGKVILDKVQSEAFELEVEACNLEVFFTHPIMV